MRVFCDTSFFIALYDANDQYHTRATAALRTFAKQEVICYTSDYVYDETVTFLLNTHPSYGYLRAKQFDRDIREDADLQTIFVSDVVFQRSREMFFKFNKDKQWSFTDCTSFAIMEDYALRDALGFDQNFIQRGFRLLPG